MIELLIYIFLGLTSFMLCWWIIRTPHLHGHLTTDPAKGIQKFHIEPTPRVGGVAVFMAILTMPFLFGAAVEPLNLAIISGVPVFFAGLGEDIFKVVPPKMRLFIAFVSAFSFLIGSGYVANSITTPILKPLFEFYPFALIVSALALAGMANAVNIIDGFNGLAAGTLLIAFATMGALALWVQDQELARFAFIHFAAILGVFLWNFPYGKIFMGDGGAYYLGFALGAGLIMLFERNQEVSPWVTLLIVAYPVAETLLSIYRRVMRSGAKFHNADKIHLHHLDRRSFARRISRRLSLSEAMINPISGAIMWVFPLVSCALALLGFMLSPMNAIGYCFAYFALYFALYFRLVRNYAKPRLSKRNRK